MFSVCGMFELLQYSYMANKNCMIVYLYSITTQTSQYTALHTLAQHNQNFTKPWPLTRKYLASSSFCSSYATLLIKHIASPRTPVLLVEHFTGQMIPVHNNATRSGSLVSILATFFKTWRRSKNATMHAMIKTQIAACIALRLFLPTLSQMPKKKRKKNK